MGDGAPVSEPAPAKLNPYLRIVGRRDDGFHEIETLVQPITLADGVQARPGRGLRLAVAGEGAPAVPRGEDNLVLTAARALRQACDVDAGADLLLAKRVPVAAGLGGGSADAAAALRALDRLWGCGLGAPGLVRIAAEVGSDVPALVPGGPVVARGRGERVESVEARRTWWVLVVPGFGIRAAEAYAWWDEDAPAEAPDVEPVLRALASGDVTTLAGLAFNALEGPVVRRRPEVGEVKEQLLRAGALAAVMSGSGPAVAGLVRDGEEAERVAAVTGGVAVAAITRT
ncbi:MAG TPA: 4-(cytidine 5'-diphospho)-2-C-methyl-D-erythritol kinase [Actinomycetota bacterium]|nr:4-(cytidine 5'-diphospho)-2-C-methyl-D-erythritol kinase [Actinomycetota bacterium]